MPAYRFHSIEPEGVWTSEPFPSAERRHIVQGVIAGFLSGHPRWATDMEGNFIYGLDAKGKEMKSAPRSHSTKKARSTTKEKRLHFAGYDFTSGPEGTVVHRPTPAIPGFQPGDRVQYRDVNLWQQGTVTGSDGKWIMVRWDGNSFVSREWAPNLRHVSAHATRSSASRHHATKKSPAQLDREIAEALAKQRGAQETEEEGLYAELMARRPIAPTRGSAAAEDDEEGAYAELMARRPLAPTRASKETSVLPPSVRVARAGLKSMREHGIKNLRYGLYRHASDRAYQWGNFTGTPEHVITAVVPNAKNTASQEALIRALKWKR